MCLVNKFMSMWFYVFLAILGWFLVICYVKLVCDGRKRRKNVVRTLIVIGSGGHTTEMLCLVKNLTSHYKPRVYVMADNDVTSASKILRTEELLKQCNSFSIIKIPRSRNVHQSYLTSIITTLYSVFRSIIPVIAFKPDLLLCNGPGTCIPVCVIVYLLKKLAFWRTKIIFIESICRVKTLSLSGKILLHIADHVLVQWPELTEKYSNVEYIGRLL